ncbi:MAG: CatB-related O-acetyltransferase [Acidobacteria bacterium]|nr:CatB-related O-acetyltransferase [Acidobacteriota bacterium]
MPSTIGRHTYHPGDLRLRAWAAEEEIHIGNFCSIADQVQIFAGGRHRADQASTFPFHAVMLKRPGLDPVYQSTRPTRIGHDVWIGSGVMVMGGVQVGHGAVLSAGAVVAMDVPPFAVVVGNPAQPVRYRFSRGTVERLLRIAWWDWPDERIIRNLSWFQKSILDFVNHFDPQGVLPA